MRIPGADPRRPVQSLGRESVGAPLQVAGAAARAATTEGAALLTAGSALEGLGRYMTDQDIKQAQHDATIAGQKAAYELAERQATRGLPDQDYDLDTVPDSVKSTLPNEDIEEATAHLDGTVSTQPKRTVNGWKVSVQTFDSDHQAVGEAYMQNLSPRAREMFEKSWQRVGLEMRERVMTSSVNAARKHYKQERLQAAVLAANKGDMVGARQIIMAGVESGLYSAPEGADYIRKVEVGQELNNIDKIEMRAIQAEENNDLPGMQNSRAEILANIQRLSDPEYAGVLSPDQRRQAVEQLEGRLNETDSEIKKSTAFVNAKRAQQLEFDIDSGRAGPGQIEAAAKAGWIEPNEYRRLMRRYQERRKKQVASAAMASKREAWDKKGQRPNPTNKADQKIINAEYADALKKSPDDAISSGVQITVRRGYMPKEFEGLLIGMASSGDMQQEQLAAQAWRQIKKSQGTQHVLAKFDRVTRNRLDIISRHQEAGVSPASTRETLRRLDTMNTSQKEALYKQADNAELQNQSSEAYLEFADEDPQFDVAIRGAPERISPYLREMLRGFEREYFVLNGGDIDAARRSAFDEIRGIAGGSMINESLDDSVLGGMQIMRAPPEPTFGITREALKYDIAQQAEARGYSPSNLLFMADDRTVADPASAGYFVQVRDASGGFSTARNADGTPWRYVPDREAEARGERTRAAEAEAVERRQRTELREDPYSGAVFPIPDVEEAEAQEPVDVDAADIGF